MRLNADPVGPIIGGLALLGLLLGNELDGIQTPQAKSQPQVRTQPATKPRRVSPQAPKAESLQARRIAHQLIICTDELTKMRATYDGFVKDDVERVGADSELRMQLLRSRRACFGFEEEDHVLWFLARTSLIKKNFQTAAYHLEELIFNDVSSAYDEAFRAPALRIILGDCPEKDAKGLEVLRDIFLSYDRGELEPIAAMVDNIALSACDALATYGNRIKDSLAQRTDTSAAK